MSPSTSLSVLIEAMGIGRAGGGRTATIELLRGLVEAEPTIRICVLLDTYIQELSNYAQITQQIYPWKNRFLARLFLQLYLPFLSRRGRFDIVHHAKNLSVFGVAGVNVVTVYDLANLVIPEIFPRGDNFFWKVVQPVMLRRVDHIIAISETTANDIKHFYKIPSNRISTIYLAIPDRFRIQNKDDITQVLRIFKIDQPYIIHVGSISPKKNLRPLLMAFDAVKHSGWKGKLVLVGERYMTLARSPVVELVREMHLEDDVVFTGGISDALLPCLLAGAELFVFPSLYEGFGLAAVEAMASGVPVIATSTGAVPEAVGEAGLLISPNATPEELGSVIISILGNEPVRLRMREQGVLWASQFTSAKLGAATASLYRNLLRRS